MTVNNYYYTTPPTQNQQSMSREPVPSQEIATPQMRAEKEVQTAVEEKRVEQKQVEQKQTDVKKSEQVTAQKAENASRVTGVGSNINVLV